MKVDPSIKPRPVVFDGGGPERRECPAFDAKFQFCCVRIIKIISEHAGKRLRCGGRTGGMPAGVFGERRRLQVRTPVGIDILVDRRLRPHGIVPVFFIPALYKSVEECNSGLRISTYRGWEVGFRLFGSYADNAHPMTWGRKFLGAEHKVTGYIQLKRI